MANAERLFRLSAIGLLASLSMLGVCSPLSANACELAGDTWTLTLTEVRVDGVRTDEGVGATAELRALYEQIITFGSGDVRRQLVR